MEYYGGILLADSDLNHHGILGQRKGVRNGPPYPLNPGRHSASEKKAGWRKSLGGGGLFSKKKKKSKSVNSQLKKELTKEEYESQKQEALKKGKASEVLKYKGDLTNQQLQDAVNRIRLETQLAEYSSKETASTWNKIDKTMNKVNTVNNWANIGLNAINTTEKLYQKLFAEEQKTQANQQNKP